MDIKLEPDQEFGVGWILNSLSKHKGCYLADIMGYGKSAQSIAVAKQALNKGPVLIIAPSYICFNWVLELLFSNLILIVVILFQGEIRRALAQIGSNPFFLGRTGDQQRQSLHRRSGRVRHGHRRCHGSSESDRSGQDPPR